jgi:uncharacterized protein with GYD domain
MLSPTQPPTFNNLIAAAHRSPIQLPIWHRPFSAGHESLKKEDEQMPIFMMFGKYTTAAMQSISPERTEKAVQLIKANGGKIVSMYAVMGEHDLVFTLDFPDAEDALATSVALNRLTGISFSTSPVVAVEMFDKLIAKVKKI